MAQGNRLEEVLQGKGENYILPFFWMHGEEEAVLREEMEKVYACGIRAVCVESRPHPEFGREAWFKDMDIIMDEARRRSMKVWVLDDKKFPTGWCNGAILEKHPELSKLYLAERHMDVIGPAKDNAVLIQPFLGKDGELLAVLAIHKPDTQTLAVDGERVLDLTGNVQDGMVYFDIPEGFWRIFVLYTTRTGGGREGYMNLLDSASVNVLLQEVYEPHYKKYQNDFGKTFAGFFSDEPEIGNVQGYGFQCTLGMRDVRLPWSHELEKMLRSCWKERFALNLPALWYEYGEQTPQIRTTYMDNVTRLVEKNFSGQIGQWCRNHGVEYIGHIIEDDNAHARLGCSIGHFFRAQTGQDMSGIDVVLLQILPGFTETIHQWIASDRDGEFFHFGLAKLGSSGAHIDPAKKGRAFCEIFGAYGWAEGVGLMRWLTDHMLVRGINTFVPHAFSPLFPDKDCPPHFYARGNNPQYRFFARLMEYMNRLCHLMNGGKPALDAAVLYHVEAEWSGREAMLFQKPVRRLLEKQLDCDVIPADALHSAVLNDNVFTINGVEYRALILPSCTMLTDAAAEFAVLAAARGVQVYMLEKLPEACTSGEPLPSGFAETVRVLPLEELADTLVQDTGADLTIDGTWPYLRASRYRHQGDTVLMFFNEHPWDAAECTVTLRKKTQEVCTLTRYDAFENRAFGVECVQDETFLHWSLQLEAGESAVFILTQGEPALPVPEIPNKVQALDLSWKIGKASAQAYPVFEEVMEVSQGESLPNMNGKDYFPRFTGTFCYRAEFDVPNGLVPGMPVWLELPEVGGCVEVFLNGQYAGMGIGKPFRFDIHSLIQSHNQITLEVTNTLVWQVRDGQSTHMQLMPTGILAAPVLYYKSKEKV